MEHSKKIVMLGTSLETMGGIAAVAKVYRDDGLFERYAIRYIATHCDGTVMQKLRIGASAWVAFMRMLLQRKVGLIHVHTASNSSFWRKTLFIFPAFIFKVPCVLHLHGGGFKTFYSARSGAIAKWVIRYVYDHAAGVIVLSTTWQHWAQSISKNSRIKPIFNPVKFPKKVAFSQRDSAGILFLGKLGAGKGIYDLLHAVASIVPRHPDVHLFLGGDGELDQVRAAASDLGIGAHVTILGWVGEAEKAALLRRAAVFVLPSYAEGLPMSMLEAMAAGMPVIGTPVGGIPEVVTDGLEGYLVPPGDIAALLVALKRLLDDASLRERMGQAAREKIASTFAVMHILPQVERLYQDLGVPPTKEKYRHHRIPST